MTAHPMPRAQITQGPIDLCALEAEAADDSHGAIVSFLGVVRNHSRGRRVLRLHYEAFEPMAQKMMDEICAEAMRRWAVDMAISHRLGLIEIGEASVGIVVASAHRADAFEACRYAIERIKADVPIWKREYYEECAVWVEEPAADPEGGRIANE